MLHKLLALLALFSYSAYADDVQIIDPDVPAMVDVSDDVVSVSKCKRIARLAYNGDVDLLFCPVGDVGCFATTTGGVDCVYPDHFRYRESDYGQGRWNACRKVALLEYDTGGYPVLSGGSLELCEVGRRSRAIKCFVSSLGGLDCR